MKRGLIKSKASDHAIAATIQTGQAISPEAFLPPSMRSIPREPTEADYEARANAAGITKTSPY